MMLNPVVLYVHGGETPPPRLPPMYGKCNNPAIEPYSIAGLVYLNNYEVSDRLIV